MQTYEEMIEQTKNKIYAGLYGISYDGRREPAELVVEMIEQLISLRVNEETNKLRNELNRELDSLTSRVAELDGIYP